MAYQGARHSTPMMILIGEPAKALRLEGLFNPTAGRFVVRIAGEDPRPLAFPAARAALAGTPRDVAVWHTMGAM
ncbi:hypothetical protein AB0M02_17875 [Actinoplanes sp. NPDC051861]|uniref:hypothetical protein n=1 Tax=Actinoplanes sp. NPDC051861 TaxID=3155170 RepID=UPI00342D9E83